jgi:hypothetical protein
MPPLPRRHPLGGLRPDWAVIPDRDWAGERARETSVGFPECASQSRARHPPDASSVSGFTRLQYFAAERIEFLLSSLDTCALLTVPRGRQAHLENQQLGCLRPSLTPGWRDYLAGYEGAEHGCERGTRERAPYCGNEPIERYPQRSARSNNGRRIDGSARGACRV